MDTEKLTDTERDKSIRRKVFYVYPNGQATLTAVLSLMDDESCNDPEYTWYEDRLVKYFSLAADIATTIVFYKTVDSTFTTWTTADGDITFGAATGSSDTIYGIKVVDASVFRVGNIVKFTAIPTAGGTEEVRGRVLNVDTTNNRIAFVVIGEDSSEIDYDAAAHDTYYVEVIGSSHSEGQTGSTEGTYTLPKRFYNYTQIFRTPWSMTGTAVHTFANFDKTGAYRDKAKKHAMANMLELEKAFIFGTRDEYVDTENSSGLPIRTTGGIIWHLEQWEAGTTYGETAVDTSTDGGNGEDNKRIIDLGDYSSNANSLNYARYDDLLERLFRQTTNVSDEKLVLCGNGFLKNINTLYKGEVTWNVNQPHTGIFGINVVSHTTPFGTAHYKTHPAFTQNPELRNNALFLDVHNLKYRYLEGRDTQLLKNRQPNDADFRKDEWLTEAGLECRVPESHMYIKNLTGTH